MVKKITAGIDIGTYQIKVVITELVEENGKIFPKIIGKGLAESRGLRHGYVINSSEVIKSIKKAVSQAEKEAKRSIKKAYVSIGGISLEGIISYGSTVISRADSEVTELDVEKVLELSEDTTQLINKKIIHTIPLQYKIDNKEVLGRPIGMKGSKLKVKTLFITCLEQHLNDLMQAVEESGIEIEDVIASPIAASFVTLTKTQKIAGCVLANIGAETVSIIVFENSIPISLEVFPIGSTDITNNIALELKIPIEEAEKIKIEHSDQMISSKRKTEEIIADKLYDIFSLIEAHLKKIEKNELLPAGIVIIGGGSGINTIEHLAKTSLKLPSRIASIQFTNGNEQIKNPIWVVAYGLCILGLTSEKEFTGIKPAVKETWIRIIKWIKQIFQQFLP